MPSRSVATNDSEGRARLTIDVTPTSTGVNYSASVTDNNPSFTGFGSSGASWSVTVAGTSVANASNRSYDFGSGNISNPFFPRSVSGSLTLSPGTYTASGFFQGAGVVGRATISSFSFTVSAPTPAPNSFTNTPYLSGTVGSSYSDIVYSFGTTTSISRSGSLPPGLSGFYESQGYRVSGTPTTAGTYSFTLTASNGVGGTTSYNASITISDPIPPPPAPSTPGSFTSGAIGTTSIATSWTASSGATGYELFRDGSFVASTTSTSYTFSSLASNTSYTLGVRAYASGAGGTSYSSTTTIVRSTLPVTFTVPSVFGQSRSVAINTLQTAGFGSVSVTDVTTGATISNNLLTFSQSPSSGTTAISGSAATIDVYDFRTAVPSIIGQTETQALATLTSSGFNSRSSSLTTSGATVSNNLKVGTQSPTAGTQANPASSVTFTIFNFLTAVPNVVGQTLDNAITTLGNLGFVTVSTTLDEVGATEDNVGKVKSQTPTNSATTFNPASTSVNLTIFSLGVTGKRFTGTGFVALSNAKRFDGTVWQPITVAKRFNGTTWLDISN
jgi:beta-lactam-binding protein with PASTA domain